MVVTVTDSSSAQSAAMLHDPQPQVFTYEKPLVVGEKKFRHPLAKTDLALVEVQVFHEGGENRLHAHAHQDGFWFVKAGKVRFYTTDDEVVAELEENQGIAIPRGFKYWFESIPSPQGDDLELIHFAAADQPDLGHDHLYFQRSGETT